MIWLGFSWAFLLGFLMSTLKFGKLMWQRIPDFLFGPSIEGLAISTFFKRQKKKVWQRSGVNSLIKIPKKRLGSFPYTPLGCGHVTTSLLFHRKKNMF